MSETHSSHFNATNLSTEIYVTTLCRGDRSFTEALSSLFPINILFTGHRALAEPGADGHAGQGLHDRGPGPALRPGGGS